MTLTQTTDHVTAAKLLLIEQYRGKPHLEAVLSAFTPQIQILEDVFFDLLTNRWIEDAEGAQLDTLGAILGQDRLGMGDAGYRLMLRVRIRINLTNGTPEDLLQIPALIFAAFPSLTFHLVEFAPAAGADTTGFVMRFDFGSDTSDLAPILALARPAGVRASLEYFTEDASTTFTFASGDTAETDAARGFADDGATAGGMFADAVEI